MEDPNKKARVNAGQSSPEIFAARKSPSREPCSIWRSLVAEAKTVKENDEFMKEIIDRGILEHEGFASAMTTLLADQFATERVPAAKWAALFSTAYEKDIIYHEGYDSARAMGLLDLIATAERDPASGGMVNPFLYYKGYKALQTHRIAHILWNQGRKDAARAIQSRCSDLFAVDIHPAARIGAGLLIDHGTGIVVGESAVVGSNCSFLHGVTLGSTGKEAGDRHPKVGNDVLIGCNATVLGSIRIGNCCKIGSGSLVLKALPDNVTAVGNPARIVGRVTDMSAGRNMDTAMEHVVNNKGIKFSDTYSLWPDGEVDMFYI